MPRVKSEKQYNTFVKGIITEASPLTFPENASLDEDNFVLKRNGSRERRLGINYETGYSILPTGALETTVKSTRCSFHKWQSPNGDSSISIGVIRIHNKLWFFDLLSGPIGSNLLNNGNPVVIDGLLGSEIETAVINNFFVLVSKDLAKPVVIAYDRDTGTFEQSTYPIQVRDLWGVEDSLQVSYRPTTLTKLHEYNLLNQGWNSSILTRCSSGGTSDVLAAYETVLSAGSILNTYNFIAQQAYSTAPAVDCTNTRISVFPSNADIWSLGKYPNSADAANFERYDPDTMQKYSTDNVAAPKGSLIIDAFQRGYSRRLLFGDNTLLLDEENGTITTIAAYAGRVFYSGISSNVSNGDPKSPNYSNIVFYSQLVDNIDKVGRCYQDADPTSERISDLVDTDGGYIQIPEATRIVKLIPARTSLLVFAENGVWEIFGTDTSGFTATEHQVHKVASTGCSSPKSIVEASGAILAWTKAGIYIYAPDSVTGRFKGENVSLTTIQTLYNEISEVAKDNARGFYNEKENIVRWLYNDTSEYSSVEYVNRYNRELVLDLTLQAFYLNSIDISLGPYIADYIETPSYIVGEFENPITSNGIEVVSNTFSVVITQEDLSERVSQFNFLTIIGNNFTFSEYNNSAFRDWQYYNGVGVDYSSYLVTGHEIFGEILRHKQTPYIWFYFKRTEDGFTQVGDDLVQDNQSSCFVRAKWNWADSANSGQWGSRFQAYRLLKNYIPTGPSDTFDYGYSVVVTRNLIRGYGRALSLLIESEEGKDMKLLGWGMIVTGDARPDGN